MPDYNKSIIDFFLEKQFPGNKNLQDKYKKRFNERRCSERRFIEDYYLLNRDSEKEAKSKFEQLQVQFNRTIAVRRIKRRWVKLIISIAVAWVIIYQWPYITSLFSTKIKSAQVEESKTLYCITPSGFRLHDRPGHIFEITGRMLFGDSAINERDTTDNIWIKIRVSNKFHYVPKHYLKPCAVYHGIDSLYPNWKFSRRYEDIHSKIAMRVVDIIRTTLHGNLKEWQIPFKLEPIVADSQVKAVLPIPVIIDSVHLPGEIIAFQKYHSVILRKRFPDTLGIFDYYLLELTLGSDAEVISSVKYPFKDSSDSCNFLIKNKNDLDSGIIASNVFLQNGNGKVLAELLPLQSDTIKLRKAVYWKWMR